MSSVSKKEQSEKVRKGKENVLSFGCGEEGYPGAKDGKRMTKGPNPSRRFDLKIIPAPNFPGWRK